MKSQEYYLQPSLELPSIATSPFKSTLAFHFSLDLYCGIYFFSPKTSLNLNLAFVCLQCSTMQANGNANSRFLLALSCSLLTTPKAWKNGLTIQACLNMSAGYYCSHSRHHLLLRVHCDTSSEESIYFHYSNSMNIENHLRCFFFVISVSNQNYQKIPTKNTTATSDIC